MKKILLSGAAVCSSMLAMAQMGGVAGTFAYDDFKKASTYSDVYSIETDKMQCGDMSDSAAYMGIFTYADKTLEETHDSVSYTQTRNMTDGQLEIEMYQAKGSYNPFGFIFGSYCEEGLEKEFSLDLTDNAMLSFSVEATEFTLGETESGASDEGEGIQMKIQATDAHGVSLAYDKSYNEEKPGDFYIYEIGITGDGTANSNFGLDEKNNFTMEDGVIDISYDLKDAIPTGGEANGDKPDRSLVFDYSQVVAIKLTFVSNTKDTEDGYKSYSYNGKFIIKEFKVGNVQVGVSKAKETLAATLYPNPATNVVNFSEELENVAVFNSKGTQVFSAAKATKVDVSGLTNGIYFLQTSKGSKSFIVE